MESPTGPERQLAYRAIAAKARDLYLSHSTPGLVSYLTTALGNVELPEEHVALTYTACLRAEGEGLPSLTHLRMFTKLMIPELLDLTEERIAMYRTLSIKLSSELCNEMIQKAMMTAKLMAESLGTEIEIVAEQKTRSDQLEWMDIDVATHSGLYLH